jgi:hypothetical protein
MVSPGKPTKVETYFMVAAGFSPVYYQHLVSAVKNRLRRFLVGDGKSCWMLVRRSEVRRESASAKVLVRRKVAERKKGMRRTTWQPGKLGPSG